MKDTDLILEDVKSVVCKYLANYPLTKARLLRTVYNTRYRHRNKVENRGEEYRLATRAMFERFGGIYPPSDIHKRILRPRVEGATVRYRLIDGLPYIQIKYYYHLLKYIPEGGKTAKRMNLLSYLNMRQAVCTKRKNRPLRKIKNELLDMGYTIKQTGDADFDSIHILLEPLSYRFYKDLYRYRKGFKELTVLKRICDNRSGLLGCFIVHKIFEKHGLQYYILRSVEYGTIDRTEEALTLRELVYYGYVQVGMSNYEHLQQLVSYWNDLDRVNIYPPTEAMIYCTRVSYKKYCIRKKLLRRKERKERGLINQSKKT